MHKRRPKKGRRDTLALTYVTQAYLWVMVALFPLLPVVGGYEELSSRAFLFFSTASVLYLAAMVSTAAELALVDGGGRALLAPLRARRAARLCFLAYLAWSALSALLSPYEGVWIGLGRYEGLLSICLYVLVFLAVSSYGRPDSRLLYLLGAVVAVNAAIGTLQYAGWNPLWLFPEGTDYHDAFILYNGAFMGTLGNVDLLSAFLCLAVPVFYGAYLATGRKLALVPMGLGGYLLALADVDSGYLGILGALLLTIPFYYRTRRACWRGMVAVGTLLAALGVGKLLYADRDVSLCLRPGAVSVGAIVLGASAAALGALLRRRQDQGRAAAAQPLWRTRWLWAALGGLAVVGVIAAYAIPFSSGPAYELHQILHGNIDPSFGSGRIRIWQEVVRLIGEAPLFGGGPDTLVARMTFTFTRYSEEVGGTIEAVVDAAHNECLNIAVNQGLPALAAYLAGIAICLRRAWQRRSKTAAVLLAGLVGHLVQGCFTINTCPVAAPFWISLALCERDQDINDQNDKEEQQT